MAATDLENLLAKVNALIEAFEPFREALEKNDTDTLGLATSDNTPIFTFEGSWTGSKTVRLGDLRKLAKAVKLLCQPECESFVFEHHGGETLVDGKLSWPHHMRIRMSRSNAFTHAMFLMEQFQRHPEQETVSFTMLGKLAVEDE